MSRRDIWGGEESLVVGKGMRVWGGEHARMYLCEILKEYIDLQIKLKIKKIKASCLKIQGGKRNVCINPEGHLAVYFCLILINWF